jgi:single-stranded DNA-binding protein
MNRCVIEGEITRDPEPKTVKSSKGEFRLLTFSVAVDNQKGGKTYFRCNAWRDLATKYEGKLTKGQKVHVVGSIGASAYIKDGSAKASLDLTVEEVGDIPTQQGFIEVESPDDFPF